MKTIEVIFTDTRRDPKITDTKYLFLCDNLEVCIGDLITLHLVGAEVTFLIKKK